MNSEVFSSKATIYSDGIINADKNLVFVLRLIGCLIRRDTED